MDLKEPFKIPVSAIILDLAGTLLLALGIIDLMEINISFLGFLNGDPRQGWTLVVFGIVFITAATMLILGLVLARRKSRQAPPVVERRQR